ncbi:hypothetical protein B0T14DRAFT_438697, partial [Immersiella caudata]
LSLAAGVAAVIQLVDRVAQVCKSYIDGVSDYPKDLRIIFVEVGSLAVVFQGLQFLKEDDNEDALTLSDLGGPDGVIQECRKIMGELSSLLPVPPLPSRVTGNAGHKRRKVRAVLNALDALAWPLKRENAHKLLVTWCDSSRPLAWPSGLQYCKKDFRQYRDLGLMNKTNRREVQAIKMTLSKSQTREVCQWLQTTDPSPSHNAARWLYEDETCSWTVRSRQWMDWLTRKTRCIWMHGIPGSGKTVLVDIHTHVTRRIRAEPRFRN